MTKQSLQLWLANGWVHKHTTSRQEIELLFGIVNNVYVDLDADITNDTRFQVTYRGILALCKIMMAISGYRIERDSHYHLSIAAIRLVLGSEYAKMASFLEQCRTKRDALVYSLSGTATDKEVRDLIATFHKLETAVLLWASRVAPKLTKGIA